MSMLSATYNVYSSICLKCLERASCVASRNVIRAVIDSWKVEEFLVGDVFFVTLTQGGIDLKPRSELTYIVDEAGFGRRLDFLPEVFA